ncbi:putative E3 ubiquitin-protein ligase [Microbotryomycetes sp. JL201]|nr:putative E3 ubiquitin-protein ligase [Microbotryomycetes sp. JL201]
MQGSGPASSSSFAPPASSPPSAYPPYRPTSAQTQPPPPPLPPNWTPGQSFYLGGSAAPSHIAHRRPTRAPVNTSGPQQPPYQAPHGPPPLAGQQLLDSAHCACCNTSLRYPRGSLNFRCTVCGTINDLDRSLGAPRPVVAPPLPPRSHVTEDEVASLAELCHRSPQSSTSASQTSFTGQLDALSLRDSEIDPETALLDAVRRSFASLPSLEASFRPAGAVQLPERLPKFKTLKTFFDLIKRRKTVAGELRRLIGAILMRPGAQVHASDGGWLISLIEAPVFYPDGGSDASHRQHLLSSLIGLISNLPNQMHHALVAHYLSSTTDPYPREALLRKIELVVSFISLRVGSSPEGGFENDWAVRAAAKVSALFFAANTNQPRVPVSAFYVTLIDSLGEAAITQSFLRWESREGVSLCAYPHLLSLGAKMHLLNFDGQRQMEDKAREALISTLMRRMLEMPFLHLKVRRTHIVQDSLEQISANRVNLKKALKVSFVGEDGIDAGGIRKEWFLLLCRQLFDPQWGMFTLDADTNLCWFNPASQDLDEFYLVGVVVGLACYNAATLDIPLPQAIYKKLQNEKVTLHDLSLLHPALARGLQQLLDYDGDDVEDVFCRSFVGEIEEWGSVREVELLPGGKDRPVTRANRHEFVNLYVDFLLSVSVAEQFKAFSTGFTQVTSGNALSLFKGEELELLVRGSSEELDIEQLEHAAIYEGWDAEDDTVKLFWHVFKTFDADEQRQLLLFITGSDRVPATGTSALTLKITCSGSDITRFPTSHTCFNQLCLYRYPDEAIMRDKLRTAMKESEGFGLR